MEREIELLSRVIANHLFLGQFEPLRALLLSLRKRDRELALSILRRIVLEGGRIDGVLFSDSCSSPSHLAWLSALELLKFEAAGIDPEALRSRVELLLLIQLVLSKSSGQDVDILNKILDFALKKLKGDDEGGTVVTDDELRSLWSLILENCEIFDSICGNIQQQVQLLSESSSGLDGLDVLVRLQRNVQLAHLDALKEKLKADDWVGAVSHIQFFRQGYGVEETEYK